jgi:heat shock protein HtpX
MVLGILASIIVLWFSRYREFRADAGGARLAGREKMIAALERLRLSLDQPHLAGSARRFRDLRKGWRWPGTPVHVTPIPG